MSVIIEKLENVELINADLSDYDFYYNLKCEESNIYWSGFSNKPDYNNLKEWYINNVIKGKITFYFIICNNVKVGAIYYRVISDVCYNYLSVAITDQVQCKGIATLAMKKLIENICKTNPKCELIETTIRFDNIASQRVFSKLGFVKTGKTEEMTLEAEEKNITVEFWRYVF